MAYDALINDSGKTIWVDAWAREWEGAVEDDLIDSDDPDYDGPGRSGDIWYQAPDTPDEARKMAKEFLAEVEALNPGLDLEALADESGMTDEDFAFKLTMQSLGHGIGLEDDRQAAALSPRQVLVVSTDTYGRLGLPRGAHHLSNVSSDTYHPLSARRWLRGETQEGRHERHPTVDDSSRVSAGRGSDGRAGAVATRTGHPERRRER